MEYRRTKSHPRSEFLRAPPARKAYWLNQHGTRHEIVGLYNSRDYVTGFVQCSCRIQAHRKRAVLTVRILRENEKRNFENIRPDRAWHYSHGDACLQDQQGEVRNLLVSPERCDFSRPRRRDTGSLPGVL